MISPQWLAPLVILLSGALLFLLTRRLHDGRPVLLRALPPYEAIEEQVGRAIESGRRLHLALGRGPLTGAATPTSIAALTVLNPLAEEGGASAAPPVVMVGDGTLTAAAQDTMRLAYRRARRPRLFGIDSAEFVADAAHPTAYAAGVSDAIGRGELASSMLVGRFGSELAIMTEAAARADVPQIIGTDDPVALSQAAAATDKLLIGEEFLAAGAYLDGRPAQLASLQLQDILRWLISLTILGLALYRLVVG